MSRPTLLAIALPLFLCCASTLSLEAEEADSLHTLGDVVVQARLRKETIQPQKLSSKQLQGLASASLADALRYLAGVKIKDYGGMGGIKTIDVRNMGSHHVGVFYDGVQVGNAQNGIVDLGRFSLDDIEEVALYNGQRSQVGQSAREYASASALYLRSRTPRFATGENSRLTARYRMGTIQLVNPSVKWEQRLSSTLSLSLGGEYMYSNGEYRFRYKRTNADGSVAQDTTATRHNSDIEVWRAEASLYGIHHKGSWQGKVYYLHSERGLPGAIVKNIWRTGERQGDENLFAQGVYTYEATPRYRVQIKGKYAYDYTHYVSRDSVPFQDTHLTRSAHFDNKYYQQEYYLSTSHSYELLPEWSASLSVDYQYNKLNASMSGAGEAFAMPRRSTLWVALASALHRPLYQLQGSLLVTHATDHTALPDVPTPRRTTLSPSLFGSWHPLQDKSLSINAFYKRILRLPSFNDLYYTQIGYSRLRPEIADQVNLGVQYLLPHRSHLIRSLAVQVDAYYAWITDKIVATPSGSSFRWTMSNMGRVHSRGIDATLSTELRLGDVDLSSRLTYSYTRAQDRSRLNGLPLSSYGHQIPYTPWHSGSWATQMSYRGWGLNYSFVYVGERYNGGINNIPVNHVEPWYTHDVALSYSTPLLGCRLDASLEINNLLDQQYDVVKNYPMPGRNARLVFKLII